MTASPHSHLTKTHDALAGARQILGLGLSAVAAREAYLGAFHAALALIIHRTGRSPRTHRGVQVEFARLARDEPALGREMVAFLSVAYDYKSDADYDVTDAPPVSLTLAKEAIERAAALADSVARLIATP